MKKPVKPKMPKKPTMPKGGIKTEAQLKAYDQRVDNYKKVVAVKMKKYNADLSKYNAFIKKVQKAKQKLA